MPRPQATTISSPLSVNVTVGASVQLYSASATKNTTPAQNNSSDTRGFLRVFISWGVFDMGLEVTILCGAAPFKPCVFFESPRAIPYRLANWPSCKSVIKKRAAGHQWTQREKKRSAKLLRHSQAPACGKSWTEGAANKNMVVQIPDCCLTRRGVVKQIFGFAVTVKIRCGHQCPATGNRWPPGATNKSRSRQIEDSCVACVGME